MKILIRLRLSVAFIVSLLVGATGFANADELEFDAKLSGVQEVVFDSSGKFVAGGRDTPASGRVHARFDKAFEKVKLDVKIENLLGSFAGAHFHCGRPGQNGPVAFGLVSPGPLVFDGKGIRGTLTNTDYSGGDCTAVIGRPVNNLAALALAMRDGLIYLNIHSTVFPPGESRGQVLEKDGKHHHKKRHD